MSAISMIRRACTVLPLMLCIGLSLPAHSETVTTDDSIRIVNDPGGNVMQTIMRRQELGQSGKRIEIRGYCRSACTLYLSLPNACIGRGATVGFHAPHFPGTEIITPFMGDLMAPYFRGAVRQRWLSTWQYKTEITRLSSAQYRELDPQMKLCPRMGRSKTAKRARNQN